MIIGARAPLNANVGRHFPRCAAHQLSLNSHDCFLPSPDHRNPVSPEHRRQCLIVMSALIAARFTNAAQPFKIPRLAFLWAAVPQSYTRQLDAFREGLRDFGYIEGKNIDVAHRWAEGDDTRLPVLAAELVRWGPDVIVTQSTRGVRAVKQATASIPIVMASGGDLIAAGLAATLARPAGQVTGSTIFTDEMNSKRLEVLRDALPQLQRVAVLLQDSTTQIKSAVEVERVGSTLGFKIMVFHVRSATEIEIAFMKMSSAGVQAVAFGESPLLNSHAHLIAQLALKARLPSIGSRDFAAVGGLMNYGTDSSVQFRRAAYFVDKILKGTRPGEIPIERASRFELVVNLKTAKALGITIPSIVTVRAERLIE